MSEEKKKARAAKKVKKKKVPEIEDPVVLPPGFWLFMLALPIFAALVTYVFRDEPRSPQDEAVAAQQSAPVPEQERAVTRYNSGLPRRAGTQHVPETISEERLKACDFGDWIGKRLNTRVLKAYLGHYRVISAGYEVRPANDPKMINIEVDKRTIVTRIWCG